jgi:ferric-dicitrate binding protein FerR (iron transport regulator)
MRPGVTTPPARYNACVSAPESHASVEREIAALSRKIERGRAELASLREHGPEPRGMIPGVFAGMLLVLAAFVAFAVWVDSFAVKVPL